MSVSKEIERYVFQGCMPLGTLRIANFDVCVSGYKWLYIRFHLVMVNFKLYYMKFAAILREFSLSFFTLN